MTDPKEKLPSEQTVHDLTEYHDDEDARRLLSLHAQNPEEMEDIKQMMRTIRKDRSGTMPPIVRKLGYIAAAITFVALGVITIVLVQELPFATRIYGPNQLTPGSRATYRIALFEPEKNSFLRDFAGELWLQSKQQQTLLYKGKSKADVLLANVQIPAWPVDQSYHLLVKVRGSRGDEIIKHPVKLTHAEKVTTQYTKESSTRLWEPPDQTDKPYKLQLFAEGRSLVSDMPNWIMVRILEQQEKHVQGGHRAILSGHKARPYGVPTHAQTISPPPRQAFATSPAPTTRQAIHPQRASPPLRQAPMTSPAPTSRQAIHPQRASPPPPRQVTVTAPVPTTRQVITAAPTPRRLSIFPAHQRHHSRQPIDLFAPRTAASPTLSASSAPPQGIVWQPPSSGNIFFRIQENRTQHGPFHADKLGWIRFPYMPQFFNTVWQTEIWGPKGRAHYTFDLKNEGYQVILALPQTIWHPEKVARFRIYSHQRKGAVHIDLVQYGVRLWSQEAELDGGKSIVHLNIPKGIRGLCTLQIYTEFFFPGEVYDARLVYIGELAKDRILADLRRHLIERGDGELVLELDSFSQMTVPKDQMDRFARFLFAYTKARFTAPSLLYNSHAHKLKKLRAFQQDFRIKTLSFLGGLGGLILVGMFGWMVRGYRREQQLMLHDAAQEEMDALKGRGLALVVVALVFIGLLFATILYLFWIMKWTYDNI